MQMVCKYSCTAYTVDTEQALVPHLVYFEADAFANWKDWGLPTEQENLEKFI